MTTLIISEKPSAAKRIAFALADNNIKTTKMNTITYFEIDRNREHIIIVPAVGHLFGLVQKSSGWTYPIFDVKWELTFVSNKKLSYVKKYYQNIKSLSKKVDNFIVGTDFDIEGEVIAYNILRFICEKEDAKRMRFSTLTKEDLIKAYENVYPHIEISLAQAGIARHTLDWYYGINISRALTLAVKRVGRYKVLSSGRVQGPALKILADREVEIKNFKPKQYWQIELKTKDFSAFYIKDRIWEKREAERVIEGCKNKNAIISKLEKKQYSVPQPTPFNLTDLQIEAYRTFSFNPKQTQQIAQNLYLSALISYPRTSSQKLPAKIGYSKILRELSKNPEYNRLVNVVSKSKLKPKEGKKTDDAHPSIYPTGEKPKTLSDQEKKLYDLIIKRFLSVFGTPAVRESLNVTLEIDKYEFKVSGSQTIKEGWFNLYKPYVNLKEVVLPELKKNREVSVKEILLLDKETQPHKRYTQATIVKELESRNLGTKATRAEIVSGLYTRGYIKDRQIKVTDIGLKVIKTLEKHVPEIISEELTRSLEEKMTKIEKKKEDKENVLKRAKEHLTNILEKFKKDEKEIGEELLEAINKTKRKEETLGLCSKCKTGELRIIRTRMGSQFVGCTHYPKCNNIYPLPKNCSVKKTNKMCEHCKTPIVTIIRKSKRPWVICLDPKCSTKKDWNSSTIT